MEVRISFSDGQVKHIWSQVLFELRSLDFGFCNFSDQDIEMAKKQNRVLLIIKENVIELVFCPGHVTCLINDIPIDSYFK